MRLSKIVSACPIVSLEVAFCRCPREGGEGEEERVFIVAASGPNLLVYPITSEALVEAQTSGAVVLPVLDSHSITSIKHISDGLLLILGNKMLTVFQLDAINITQSHVVEHFSQLSDLVLDAQMIETYDFSPLLVIGYAQNYIELYLMKEHRLVNTIKCPVVCVLFSMTIAPLSDADNKRITIASGTAMGQIILWSATLDISNLKRETQPQVVHTVSGHRGVIWKLRWSKRMDRIVSVSDDRTVRVWNALKGTELFCGYGHDCRVWDAIFIGEEEGTVATCGEDTLIKVWDIALKKCVITIQGHSNKHIWCINKLIVLAKSGEEMEEMDTVLLTGGNDCCINFWPLSMHALLSGEGSGVECIKDEGYCIQDNIRALSQAERVVHLQLLSSTLSSTISLVDKIPVRIENLLVDSKRQQTVIAHRISPCGHVAVVITQAGVWMVDLKACVKLDNRNFSLENCNGPSSSRWIQVFVSERQINSCDVIFECFSTQRWQIECACVHPTGHVSYMRWFYTTSPSEDTFAQVSDFSMLTLNGHTRNSMNVTFFPKCLSSCVSDAGEILQQNSSSYFMSMSVQGECKLWRSCGEVTTCADMPNLYQKGEFITPKKNIATAASCLYEANRVIIGDCRGSISIYYSSFINPVNIALENDNFAAPTPCIQFFPKVHGLEIISCIKSFPEGFCSLGYDGFLCVFARSHDSFTAENSSFSVMFRLSCAPISSPDQLFCSHNYDGALSPSIVVCGYQASDYVIYDIRKKYQILKVEAGGWKRPHRASVEYNARYGSVDNVCFIYSFMDEDSSAIFRCMRYELAVERRLSSSSDIHDISTLATATKLPTQLGTPSLGKVAYCAAFIHGKYANNCAEGYHLAVGAEDGNVRMYSIKGKSRIVNLHQPLCDRYTCSIVQEAPMPSSVPVRAICCCASAHGDSNIVIAAGGRLIYSIWRYDNANSSARMMPLGCILEQVYTSVDTITECRRARKKPRSSCTTPSEARSGETQDHRILAVAVTPIASEKSKNCYIVVFCDSRGVSKVIRVEEQKYSEEHTDTSGELNIGSRRNVQVRHEDEFVASDYPLLCCELFELCTQLPLDNILPSISIHTVHLSVMGDTHGKVGMWLLGTSSICDR